MFIPIRTDYRMAHRPWVNYGLIAANLLIFLLGFKGDNPRIIPWLLHPDSPRLAQFFSSVFLHAGIEHLLGNMLFLWVFGNALNDKLGHVSYLAFYLAGGVLAGVGYVLLAGRVPVLGASGAISAVTGAYLVLLPRVRVTVLIIFYFITTAEISSLYFVGFNLIWNLLMTGVGWAGQGGGVAYAAHSSGFVFGIAVATGLLAVRVLPRDPMDLLNFIRHRHRRTKYRQMVSRGYDPFAGDARSRAPWQPADRSRYVPAESVQSQTPNSPSAQELALRREIAEACGLNDLHAAAEKYLQLVQIAEDAVLARPNQLDVANQLMADEHYPAAADAYERFLRHYGTYEYRGDIHLMLGLLYGRYLHQYDRAAEALQRAVETLRDPKKADLARAELAAARQQRGP